MSRNVIVVRQLLKRERHRRIKRAAALVGQACRLPKPLFIIPLDGVLYWSDTAVLPRVVSGIPWAQKAEGEGVIARVQIVQER